MAVDYVKTGVPAEFPRRLDPKTWPHFMEKHKRSYHSTTALGKLYDMVQRDTFDMKENYELPFDNRILKHTKCRALRDETLTKARRIKSQYDTTMRRVMCQLEIATEFELWTAFVMSKPRVGSDYKLQEKVGRESSALKQHFKDQCRKEAGNDLPSFVAAMYRVTYEEVRIALHEAKKPHIRPDGSLGTRRISPKTMPLVSFPWLFWDTLGKLAKEGGIVQSKVDEGSEDMDLISDVPLVSHKRRGKHTASGSGDFMDEHGEPPLFTRTSDGKIIHYGHVLNLFSHDTDDGDEKDDARDRTSSSDESAPGSNSTNSTSGLHPVVEEDLLSFDSPPASPVVKPASLEVNVPKKGKIVKYDAKFLLQFRDVVTEEPSPGLNPEIRSLIGVSGDGPSASVHTPGAGSQSDRNGASDGALPTTGDLLGPLPMLTKAELVTGLSGPVAKTYTPPLTDEETVIRGHSNRTSDRSTSTFSADPQPSTEQTPQETEDLLLDIYSASPPRTNTGLGSAAESVVAVKREPPIWVEQVVRMGHRNPTPPLEPLEIPNVVNGASQFDSPLDGTVTASAIYDPFVDPSPAAAIPATASNAGPGAGPGPVNKQMMMGLDGGNKKEDADDDESEEEVEEVALDMDEETLVERFEQMAAL